MTNVEMEFFTARALALCDLIQRFRAAGLEITSEWLETYARILGVPLVKLSNAINPIPLTHADLAVVVSVNEARSSIGLGPLILPSGSPDPDGLLSLCVYKSKAEQSDFEPRASRKPPDGA